MVIFIMISVSFNMFEVCIETDFTFNRDLCKCGLTTLLLEGYSWSLSNYVYIIYVRKDKYFFQAYELLVACYNTGYKNEINALSELFYLNIFIFNKIVY